MVGKKSPKSHMAPNIVRPGWEKTLLPSRSCRRRKRFALLIVLCLEPICVEVHNCFVPFTFHRGNNCRVVRANPKIPAPNEFSILWSLFFDPLMCRIFRRPQPYPQSPLLIQTCDQIYDSLNGAQCALMCWRIG
jgi:hypothetical protein